MAKKRHTMMRRSIGGIVSDQQLDRVFGEYTKKQYDDARAAITNQVNPALLRLYNFLHDEYLPACRTSTLGIRYVLARRHCCHGVERHHGTHWLTHAVCDDASAVPDGAAYYEFLVQKYTNDNSKTPEQVHEIGLAEVARIRAQMDDILKDNNFAGSFEDYTNALRGDTHYQFANQKDLLGRLHMP
jgi:uncharacterized protein (DUF885 family)